MAHFAVSDVAQQRFRFAQKVSRAALGLAGAQPAPLAVWIDDWSLTGTGAGRAALAAARARGGLRARPGRSPRPARRCSTARRDCRARRTSRARRATTTRSRASGARAADPRRAGPGGNRVLLGSIASGAAAGSAQPRRAGTGSRCSCEDGSTLMFYALRNRTARATRTAPAPSSARTARCVRSASQEVAIEVSDHWKNGAGVPTPRPGACAYRISRSIFACVRSCPTRSCTRRPRTGRAP